MQKTKLISLTIIGLFVITSCSTRRNMNINDFNHVKGYKTSNKIEKGDSKKYVSSSIKGNKKSKKYKTASVKNDSKQSKFESSETLAFDNESFSILTSNKNKISKLITTEDECDKIILMNGDEIKAKVTEITETTVKYKKCDNLDGPIYTKPKSKIFMIQYANGTKDVFSKGGQDTENNVNENTNTNRKNAEQKTSTDTKQKKTSDQSSNPPNRNSTSSTNRKTDQISASSFIFALGGIIFFILAVTASGPIGALVLLICTLLYFITAVILGIIGIIRTTKFPKKYKGKWMAIVGLMLGIAALLALLIITIVAVSII